MSESDSSTHKIPTLIFRILLFLMLAVGLSGRIYVRGDGLEYMLQTQSIVLDKSIRIHPEQTLRHWNHTERFKLQIPSSALTTDYTVRNGFPHYYRFGGLYRDRFGDFRYYHFWLYSLTVAPAYALLDLLAPKTDLEHFSFRIMNCLYLLIPFVLLGWTECSWLLLIFSFLTLFSPLLPYVDWQHPELFCFCLVFVSFYCVNRRGWSFFPPLFLGLGATQYPPMLLFFPLHFIYRLSASCPDSAKRWAMILSSYLLALLIAASALLYFKHYFGAYNVITAVGYASFKYMSLGRTVDMFLHPMIGAIWFYPALFCFIPAAIGRKNALFFGGAMVSAFCAAYLSTAGTNFNGGQVGSLRYTVWILAPLFFFLTRPENFRAVSGNRIRLLLFAAGVLLTLLDVRLFKTGTFLGKEDRGFRPGERATDETARLFRYTHYRGDIEVLAENILGNEIAVPKDFNSIYIWNLNRGWSLWVISQRALSQLQTFSFDSPDIPEFTSYPANEPFVWEGGKVVLKADRIRNFQTQPVLGNYVLLRVHARVKSVNSNVKVIVR